jgi:hypothetical protein
MKGDENLAEVQLSCSFFDARTGGRVADRVNGKSEAFDRAAGFQPACPALDEFLGLPVAIPAGHEAEETLRSPVLGVCEPPEWRLQGRLPAPPHAANGQSRVAGLQPRRTVTILCEPQQYDETRSACGLGQYGSTNVADVQATIDEALGTAVALNHFNSGGQVSLVDSQTVKNAVLGIGCPGVLWNASIENCSDDCQIGGELSRGRLPTSKPTPASVDAMDCDNELWTTPKQSPC